MAQATQLDEINEDDIVAALSDMGGNPISSNQDAAGVEQVSRVEQPQVAVKIKENDVVQMNLDSSNANNIIELLKQLIDGKTLEISIKVKS
ncbi:MAG: hypothetical protein KAQ94_05120 [Arcobacteraceae bacterium]|nr:hypothetical protein [Arcobacteraceae bacterium]